MAHKVWSILIVDDDPLVRRGLVSLIENRPDLTVCGEAATCTAAIDLVRDTSPDLVIVDLLLKGCDGLELVKRLKSGHPALPLLVLSMHDEMVYAERSLRAGARGYVSKSSVSDTLLIAIRRLLAGGTYMNNAVQARLAAKFVIGRTLAEDSPLDALSDRELQVFRLIGQGQRTRQIAEQLTVSIKTIESHREHIKRKMGLQSAVMLAQRAMWWVETGRIAIPTR